MRAQRSWQFTGAEARGHATLAAVVMWAVAGVIAFSGSGYRSVFGPLKGTDFVHFYTLGHVDGRTASTVLYDLEALHRLQTELVPESAPEHYLPAYPPHVAILFRPFAGLAYGTAALLWAAILAVAYAGCIWLAWRPFKTVLHDKRLLVAAAAAFPPFWYLVLHGQTTIVPLLAFCLGWLALEHRRPFWAGVAFGTLLLKPQFALVLVPLVLICREWAMLAGAAVSISVHITAIVSLLGKSVLWDYAALIVRFPQLRDRLEPKPEQMHSITAVTNRLPADWEMIAWALVSALVITRTIQIWRSNAPLSVRTGVLVLASTLVNPHLNVYDATVLAPAFVWFAGWLYGESAPAVAPRSSFVAILYALYLTLFAPTAALLPIQASAILLGALFVLVGRTVPASADAALARPVPATVRPRSL
jgi:hypothetical protein